MSESMRETIACLIVLGSAFLITIVCAAGWVL